MKKKLIALCLVIALISMLAIPIGAQSSKETALRNELKNLELKYGITFVDLNSSQFSNQKLISLTSIQEVDKLLSEFKKGLTVAPNAQQTVVNGSSLMSPAITATEYESAYVITWWAPFSGWGLNGIACWKNIAFNYKYIFVNSKPQYTSVSNINSYTTGISIAVSWNQTTSSYQIKTTTNPKDTAVFTIYGYWLLGFDIEGFTIGAKINDTWSGASLRIY